MSNHSTRVNLLEHDTFSDSTLGRILTWSLSVGRYIIVFTELIVILSFLSRFKLDRDLTNLNSDISRQEAIIKSYGELEDAVRTLQSQLSFIKEAQAGTQTYSLIDVVSQNLPNDVRIDQMQFSQQAIQVRAIALSQKGFAQFINSLQRDENISDISINNVSLTDQGNTLEFDVSASTSSNEGSKKSRN